MTSSSSSTQNPKFRLAVLLLAAGEGSRLGVHPKALLRKEGITLLQALCNAIQQFEPVQCVSVTGFHAEEIESEVIKINPSLDYPMRPVRNHAPERGQASSVRLGLESIQEEFDVLLVALSDQPEVGAKEIQELLDEYSKREGSEEIILPVVNGKRGNPVLFSHKAVFNILATPGMVCREFMDVNPGKVRTMHTSNQAFVLDVDTSEDIQKHKLSLT
ncbi:nucleotidyltransferase family protein [Polynucleobacter sp. 71A-WALBACH]|uniref:nucleotidyltransferase family protein n=1 Tax=Polynucleobacter sp. 71A-WALBACH TaxID=2689097 RepID=UPI001C0DC11A|nr:nucleotidyltransferase family protein [Polynucleobacter sp. 71A-WALBACH]MBU3594328.1 nucleotidyltransferase family protein [Polynucleobacter sp. 71A-WALBACH]